MGATITKEGFEDFRRHASDKQINNKNCVTIDQFHNVNEEFFEKTGLGKYWRTQRIKSRKTQPDIDQSWKNSCWKDLKVGEFVLLKENDQLPADVLVISSSESDGICFLETKNLDGETNLKIRRAPEQTAKINDMADLDIFQAIIECDAPHPNIYAYNGSMKCYSVNSRALFPDDDENNIKPKPLFEIPLNINNLLLRGCILRNTEWVLGLVIYTGAETKIRLNAGATPLKRSYLEGEMNNYV